MPIWTFKCNKCNKEEVDKIVPSIKTEVKCECGETMERQPNLCVNTKWDKLCVNFMPMPRSIAEDPRSYYDV